MRTHSAGFLQRGTMSLAMGSLLLLPGGFVVFLVRESLFLTLVYPLTITALLFHTHGWVRIGQAVMAQPLKTERGGVAISSGMKWAFVASILGFGIGLVSLPAIFPDRGWSGPAWVWILFLFLFPYIPSVFAPVVVAHSLVFSFGMTTLRSRHAVAPIAVGVIALFGIATAAIVTQFASRNILGYGVWLFAGLTAAGYLPAAWGWRIERSEERDVNPTAISE